MSGPIQSSAEVSYYTGEEAVVGWWTYNELDCDSGHQGAEENDADGLDPRPALHTGQATELSSLYEEGQGQLTTGYL